MKVLTTVSLWQNFEGLVPPVQLNVVACGEQIDEAFLRAIVNKGKGVFTAYDDENGLRRISGHYRRSFFVNRFVAPFADKSRIRELVHNKDEFKNWMIGAVTLDGRQALDLEDPFELDECYQMVLTICNAPNDPSYEEERYGFEDTELLLNMPLGSRVVYIGEEDDNPAHSRPGTVVKHHKNGSVTVEWDTSGQRRRYAFGQDDKYEVIQTDEPRRLEPGNSMIQVGVRVERGKDWEWGNQDGGPGNVGVVFDVEDSGVVRVCWPSGNRNMYRNGYEGKFDLKIAESESTKEDGKFPFQEPPGKSIIWSYFDVSDVFLMFNQETTMLLELKYQDNQRGSAEIDIDGVMNFVDFKEMEARRGDLVTQLAREVVTEDEFNRRIESDFELRRRQSGD